MKDYVRWFSGIRLADVPLVGGKNASLGELYAGLSARGRAGAERLRADRRGLSRRAHGGRCLDAACTGCSTISTRPTSTLLAERAAAGARDRLSRDRHARRCARQIASAYRQLESEYGANVAVAVRSSATAEDLPTASFAGQHESFLNVAASDDLFEACRRCFASIFTDRAIVYRVDNGFDHFKVALSVGVMKMVRSDRASSGVIFTLDTESGFRDVVFITGVYGLGENIVQGKVDPDEFYVHKPTFRAGLPRRAAPLARPQAVAHDLCRGRAGTTRNVPTPEAERERFCLTDAEVLKLAGNAIAIEEHYSQQAGHPMPMDIEWAKDADDGELYIVQARPETVVSQRAPTGFETYALGGTGKVLATGRAVGEKIADRPGARHRRRARPARLPARRGAGRRADHARTGSR